MNLCLKQLNFFLTNKLLTGDGYCIVSHRLTPHCTNPENIVEVLKDIQHFQSLSKTTTPIISNVAIGEIN